MSLNTHNPYTLIQWATELPIKHGPKSVLIALISYADNQTGSCFPTIKQICTRSSLGERSVQNAIRELTQLGLINRTLEMGKSTQYTVKFGTIIEAQTPAENDTPRKKCTPAKYASDPRKKRHQTPAKYAPKLTNITNQETNHVPPISPTAQKRGSRLPSGWRPDAGLIAYASERGLDPNRQTEDFCDYWHAATGKNAVKLDWSAAFRTWCRKAVDYQARQPRGFTVPQQPRRMSQADQNRLAILEHARAKAAARSAMGATFQ